MLIYFSKLKICYWVDQYNQTDLAGRRILAKHMTVGELQKKIIDCGPEYFNNGNMNPIGYARTLILILSYEEVG